MSIQDEINALNQIPLSSDQLLYSFKTRDKQSKKKWMQPKSPHAKGTGAQLENMYEDNFWYDEDDKEEDYSNFEIEEDSFWKINALYSGNPHSNENIEKALKERQRANRIKNAKLSVETKSSTSEYESSSSAETSSTTSSENNFYGLSKDKLSKNAAITGLINQNIIKLSDLKIINESKSSNKLPKHRNIKTGEQTFIDLPNYNRVGIPHPEDSDIMIHRFLAGEGAPEGVPGVDFTVDGLAIRTIVSPRQQLMRVTDDDFKFVKL